MLTIYIVSTGHHTFLKKAIESVLNHKLDLCIYVVETSSDPIDQKKSDQLVQSFGLDLFKLQNYKLPQVANYILNHVTSPFVMRLDADDWVSEDFVSIMLKKIKEKAFDAYIPSYIETDSDGAYLREVSRDQLSVSKIKDNPPHGACTIFSTNFLKKVGGYSSLYDRQDGYYMWLKILRYGTFTCVPSAKFYYRQHSFNLTGNQRELWNVRASMLIDECFNDIKNYSYCVIPILDLDTSFGKLTMEPFLGHSTLLEYELKNLQIACDVFVYAPKSVISSLPSNVSHIERSKFSTDQWQDIQEEVIDQVGIKNGYLCVKNIEYPFVNPKYVEAAISALHLFDSSSCITVEELKKDIYQSSENGLKRVEGGAIQDNDRIYKRSGGIIARRLRNGKLSFDNLITSLPADNISAIRISEIKDFMNLQGILN